MLTVYNSDSKGERIVGKNKGKHGKRTPYAEFQSVMSKLENEIEREKAIEVAEKRKNIEQ